MDPDRNNGPAPDPVKLDYPGLLREPLPSGAVRWRVRVEGNTRRRIRLHVTPDHPHFREHYHAARAGVQLPPEAAHEEVAIRGSVGWLVVKYCAAMEAMVADELMSPLTRNWRRAHLERLRQECGEYALDIPQSEILRMRDARQATPAAADTFVKAVRAMYQWGRRRGHAPNDPTAGIDWINRSRGGATPWSVDDLRAFRARHPIGTAAHLALSLLMFTACRRGDVIWLGRDQERMIGGVLHLDWQPRKKGSRRVIIPVLPPLERAIRACTVRGPGPYLLSQRGRPFTSSASFGGRMAKWCAQAGLSDRSSHGIRKAAGELLALEGASQYAIMAVHGHANAETSEIYTASIERARLARGAMERLDGMEW